MKIFPGIFALMSIPTAAALTSENKLDVSFYKSGASDDVRVDYHLAGADSHNFNGDILKLIHDLLEDNANNLASQILNQETIMEKLSDMNNGNESFKNEIMIEMKKMKEGLEETLREHIATALQQHSEATHVAMENKFNEEMEKIKNQMMLLHATEKPNDTTTEGWSFDIMSYIRRRIKSIETIFRACTKCPTKEEIIWLVILTSINYKLLPYISTEYKYIQKEVVWFFSGLVKDFVFPGSSFSYPMEGFDEDCLSIASDLYMEFDGEVP